MLSHRKIKYIKSLYEKKNRETTGKFIAEGVKMVEALLDSNIQIETIYYTYEYTRIEQYKNKNICCILVTEEELNRISHQKNPNKIIAIAYIPEYKTTYEKGPILVLDHIQDPGNLGTIVRVAAWFGIRQIFCSRDSVDIYNQKALQSTMGAAFKVKVFYTDLADLLLQFNKKNLPVYGTFTEGKNIYQTRLHDDCIVVLGNESQGISEALLPYINQKISIPSFQQTGKSIESLNVAMAASIICSEIKRQAFSNNL